MRYTILSVLILAASILTASLQAFGDQPNVIIVMADDLGWNDVGYHGSEIRTPSLDYLASQGVTLDQFHSQPTCTPTRAALMTGKAPQSLGIYRQFAKNSDKGLPTNEITLADYLKSADYQTWLVGKWHLGHVSSEYHPNSRGFDHFYGHVTGGIGHYDHVHGGGLDWQRNGTTVRDPGYSTHLIRDEVLSLLQDRDREKPFFLWLSMNAPHLPNEAPDATILSYPAIENSQRKVHAAMVTELDTALGKIIDALESEGELGNTLIWFMSDNGGLIKGDTESGLVSLVLTLEDWFGTPIPFQFFEFVRVNSVLGGSDNAPLREGKGSVYEGGARVPSLVFWPERLKPGQLDDMITVQDVLPTVLTALNMSWQGDLDGKNRWPTLTGSATQEPADYLIKGQFEDQAYYQWPWKLVSIGDRFELYNLEDDPLETTDLTAREPDRVNSLSRLLAEFPRAETVHIPIYNILIDPDFFGGEEDRPPWSEVMIKNPQ